MKNLFLLLLLFAEVCSAATRVAFFEMHDRNGNLVQLEPGGRFFHAAIQLEDGRWLHSLAPRGTQIANELSEIGARAVILTDEFGPAVSVERANKFLDLPFDFKYVWEDTLTSYCAKLIAQAANFLRLRPSPMTFSGSFWQGREPRQRGLGISPDDIFQQLKERGFAQSNWTQPCASALTNPALSSMMQAK